MVSLFLTSSTMVSTNEIVRRSQRRPPDEEDLTRSLGPDNRCCFCLTLQTGSIIIAIFNFIAGLIKFVWYCTQELTYSGFNLNAELKISALDVTILLVFIIARLCDVLLIVAAMKQKSDWDKTPLLVLPWLIINALELSLKVVVIMMLLFYGSAHIRLSTTDYTSTLAFIGVLTGAHIFCFLIIYQFRKNLVEERNIRRNARNGGNNGSTNNPQPRDFAPSAPYGTDPTTDPLLPSGYDNSSRVDPSIDKVDGNLPHGRMSPPPSYDEVVFNVGNLEETKKGYSDLLSASGRIHKEAGNSSINDNPESKTTSNSSSKRDNRNSSSRDRKPTALSSSGGNTRTPTTAQDNHTDLDEGDRNHAPPQYSDAVRLPNINPSSNSTSKGNPSISTTEQSGIL